MEIKTILKQLGITNPTAIMPFKSYEDNSEYEVWKIITPEKDYVLKKAKEYELCVYSTFFEHTTKAVPRFYGSINCGNENYFLTDFENGKDLCVCSREALKSALDSLIYLQNLYWNRNDLQDKAYTFEKSKIDRANRGKYLNDSELEKEYEKFLQQYSILPRTLCHDDLLPFNILVGQHGAAIIDWEFAGILPYPTSLARLIAHGKNERNSLFYMSDEDKKFAIKYYYENLIKSKGIPAGEYLYSMHLFLLYEYCEWIMLGVKYKDADTNRYHEYLKKAKEHICIMKSTNYKNTEL